MRNEVGYLGLRVVMPSEEPSDASLGTSAILEDQGSDRQNRRTGESIKVSLTHALQP